ncbi:MAG: hypothetical protein ACREJD_05595 [Phycisphaerales bacterium]
MFSVRPTRSSAATLSLAAIAFAASPLHAAIVTGTIEERVAPMNGYFIRTIGDGVNNVQIFLNFGYYNPTNRALGFNARYSGFSQESPGDEWTNTDIAFVPNVLDPSQLGDVSQLTFTSFALDEYVMAAAWSAAHPNPAVPTGLVVHRNVDTGHYAVVRLNDMWGFQNQAVQGSMANLTWWFQTDGTANFSSVPGPAGITTFAFASLAAARRRRA